MFRVWVRASRDTGFLRLRFLGSGFLGSGVEGLWFGDSGFLGLLRGVGVKGFWVQGFWV